MATTWNNRRGTSTRGRTNRWKTGTQAAGSTWGHGTSYQSSYRGTTARSHTAATTYQSVSRLFAQKIDSWKTVYNQTRGTAKAGRPTPAQLNTMANWINKSALVQPVSSTQLNRWAYSCDVRFTPGSATSCKSVLSAKFGKSTIKAVCKGKDGSFLVATTPVYKGKAFSFVSYK